MSQVPSDLKYAKSHEWVRVSDRGIGIPPEELEGFLGSLFERGFTGANVTLPHKEAALRLADSADAAARAPSPRPPDRPPRGAMD